MRFTTKRITGFYFDYDRYSSYFHGHNRWNSKLNEKAHFYVIDLRYDFRLSTVETKIEQVNSYKYMKEKKMFDPRKCTT